MLLFFFDSITGWQLKHDSSELIHFSFFFTNLISGLRRDSRMVHGTCKISCNP